MIQIKLRDVRHNEMAQAQPASQDASDVPRAVGTIALSSKSRAGRSHIDRFRTSGASKVTFPRRTDALEGIFLNTSGGLTGGDKFSASFTAGAHSNLVLSTQAAERGYRSHSGPAQVRTQLTVETDASLHWLPQELIAFDGINLDRQLDIEMAEGAELVAVEAVVFGRRAMGETRIKGQLNDRITLRQNGTVVYWDKIALKGAISQQLERPAIAAGMTALASVLYVGPRAQALLPKIRDTLPATGGASLVTPDVLTIRVLAQDSFLMRQTLVPLLHRLTDTTLPRSWSL